MIFTKSIYLHLQQLDPDLNTKKFGNLCARSDSYYSSVVSQGKEISNTAILRLLEWLESKRRSMATDHANISTKLNVICDIQRILVTELVDRIDVEKKTGCREIKLLIFESVANMYYWKLEKELGEIE